MARNGSSTEPAGSMPVRLARGALVAVLVLATCGVLAPRAARADATPDLALYAVYEDVHITNARGAHGVTLTNLTAQSDGRTNDADATAATPAAGDTLEAGFTDGTNITYYAMGYVLEPAVVRVPVAIDYADLPDSAIHPSYTWHYADDDTAISGATESTYTLAEGDAERGVYVEVTDAAPADAPRLEGSITSAPTAQHIGLYAVYDTVRVANAPGTRAVALANLTADGADATANLPAAGDLIEASYTDGVNMAYYVSEYDFSTTPATAAGETEVAYAKLTGATIRPSYTWRYADNHTAVPDAANSAQYRLSEAAVARGVYVEVTDTAPDGATGDAATTMRGSVTSAPIATPAGDLELHAVYGTVRIANAEGTHGATLTNVTAAESATRTGESDPAVIAPATGDVLEASYTDGEHIAYFAPTYDFDANPPAAGDDVAVAYDTLTGAVIHPRYTWRYADTNAEIADAGHTARYTVADGDALRGVYVEIADSVPDGATGDAAVAMRGTITSARTAAQGSGVALYGAYSRVRIDNAEGVRGVSLANVTATEAAGAGADDVDPTATIAQAGDELEARFADGTNIAYWVHSYDFTTTPPTDAGEVEVAYSTLVAAGAEPDIRPRYTWCHADDDTAIAGAADSARYTLTADDLERGVYVEVTDAAPEGSSGDAAATLDGSISSGATRTLVGDFTLHAVYAQVNVEDAGADATTEPEGYVEGGNGVTVRVVPADVAASAAATADVDGYADATDSATELVAGDTLVAAVSDGTRGTDELVRHFVMAYDFAEEDPGYNVKTYVDGSDLGTMHPYFTWYRVGENGADDVVVHEGLEAEGATYTLAAADAGRALRVVAEDAAGDDDPVFGGELTSAATVPTGGYNALSFAGGSNVEVAATVGTDDDAEEIDSGDDVLAGERVVLVATPVAGYRVASGDWSIVDGEGASVAASIAENADGSSTATIASMPGRAVTVSVGVTAREYALGLVAESGFSVTATPGFGQVAYGTEVTLAATQTGDATFALWLGLDDVAFATHEVDGETVAYTAADNPTVFSMPHAAVTVSVATSYSVALNANGGRAGSVTSVERELGGAAVALPVAGGAGAPSRAGYALAGWAFAADAAEPDFVSELTSDEFASRVGATLYAVWRAGRVGVTVTAGQGGQTLSGVLMADAGVQTLSGYAAAAPPRTRLLGWATSDGTMVGRADATLDEVLAALADLPRA